MNDVNVQIQQRTYACTYITPYEPIYRELCMSSLRLVYARNSIDKAMHNSCEMHAITATRQRRI